MIAPVILAFVATLPAGFTSQPQLATRAASVAGKPVTVLCATDDASWNAEEAARGHAGGDILGHADQASATVYLSPTVCGYLIAKVRGHSVSLGKFGSAVEVLAHEAEHVAGSLDEGQTECAALAALPKFVRSQFGIKKAATLRTVMTGAYSSHRAAIAYSSAYRGPCDG